MEDDKTFGAIVKVTARMLLNGKPCSLELIAAATGLPVATVDSFWRTIVIQAVREDGLPPYQPKLVK